MSSNTFISIKKVSLVLSAICIAFSSSSQCPTITLADTLVAGGSGVQLNPSLTGGGSIFSTIWTPSAGLSANNVLNPVANPSVSTLYTLTILAYNGPNLVVNGDFSAGSTGFSSTYTDYTSSGTTALPAGGYAVTTDPFAR